MLAGLERLVPARERFSLRARDGLPVGLSILLHAAVIAAALQLPRPSQLVELRVVDVEFVAPQPEALPEPPPPEPVQELVQEPPPPEPPPPEPVQVAEIGRAHV